MLPPVISMLKTKNVRKQLASKINDAVDIPMISEETEGKIIKKLIKLLIQVMEDMIAVDSDDDGE
ncbi:MAG: hypothetical protein CMM25_02870 [Rhodospirillaceae bacterium]|nr:hypothetical protein [Rhodospirillaceae bacterium]